MLGDDVVQAVKDNKKTLGTEEGRRDADNDKAAEDALDPKLERILKICSGVVAVIIVIVIFLIIGKVAGWWGGSSKDNSAKKVAEASATPDASSDVSDGDQVEVPSLVGKTLEEAQQLLEDKNLKYKLEAVESDEEAKYSCQSEPGSR